VDPQHNRTSSSQVKALHRPRRAALYWVDYLVIGATIVTFLIVLATNNPHTARAQTHSSLISASELPVQVSQMPIDAGLIKARIGLASAGL
jgi:hypothetical protein